VAVIANGGHGSVDNVVFTDTPDAHTALVPGSVATSAGTVVSGNTAGDAQVQVDTGTLPGDATTTVAYTVTVKSPLPLGVVALSNQGTVTADGRRKHAVALPGNGRGVLCTRPLHGLPPSAERDQQRKKHDEPNHSQ